VVPSLLLKIIIEMVQLSKSRRLLLIVKSCWQKQLQNLNKLISDSCWKSGTSMNRELAKDLHLSSIIVLQLHYRLTRSIFGEKTCRTMSSSQHLYSYLSSLTSNRRRHLQRFMKLSKLPVHIWLRVLQMADWSTCQSAPWCGILHLERRLTCLTSRD